MSCFHNCLWNRFITVTDVLEVVSIWIGIHFAGSFFSLGGVIVNVGSSTVISGATISITSATVAGVHMAIASATTLAAIVVSPWWTIACSELVVETIFPLVSSMNGTNIVVLRMALIARGN